MEFLIDNHFDYNWVNTTSLAVKRSTSLAVKRLLSLAFERFKSLAVKRSTI